MPDLAGTTLGHYRVLRLVGRGGMGEVYEAEDSRLGRNVALKVLPPEMARDPERRARFEQEAHAVAALSHPNIVTVHSVEKSGGLHFMTMELVEGRSLAEEIPASGLALGRIFDLAVPLADAVAAAHARGVTHRDLKPENIVLTADGRVKVLDFGLAKLREPGDDDASGTGLRTVAITQEGKILGSVAYMSPEQAEGKPVDHRSDLFSLGVILYQMATGRAPFSGDTSMSIITSILRDTPASVTELKGTLPRHLGRIVRKALEKDPERRYQTAVDLRNDLEELRRELDSGELAASSAAAAAAPRPQRSTWLWVAVGLGWGAVSMAMGFGLWWLFGGGGGAASATAPGLESGAKLSRLTTLAGEEWYPSLAPDGRSFVFAKVDGGDVDIFLQRVGGARAINLTEDSSADDTQPAVSPDGERIVFRSERQGGGLFVMGATGESVRRLTTDGYNPAWSPDGRRVAYATEGIIHPFGRATQSAIFTVAVDGGTPVEVAPGDAVHPSWSPDGTRIAYWGLPRGTGDRELYTIPAEGGEPVRLTEDDAIDWNPVWSPDGRSLYFSSDRGGALNIWRLPMDEGSGAAAGEPQPLTAGGATQEGHITVARGSGRVAFTERAEDSHIYRVGFDAKAGRLSGPPEPVVTGSLAVGFAHVSPDGTRIVYRSVADREDLWIASADGSGSRRLTNDAAKDRRPRWSPDGTEILFYSNRGGTYECWTVRPDGSGLRAVTDTPGRGAGICYWSADGTRVGYMDIVSDEPFLGDVRVPPQGRVDEAPPSPPGEPQLLGIAFSPDGRYLAGGGRHPAGDAATTYVLDTDTNAFARIGGDELASLTWLSDSRRLLALRGGELLLIDIPSGRTTTVAEGFEASTADGLALSPDDRWLYYTRRTAESDVWMLEIE